MHIFAICTTYNRDKCLQRALRCFIEQDYDDLHTLLVFNSGKPTTLEVNPEELNEYKRIVLIQRTTSLVDGIEYSSVGQKYSDAITFCDDADVVTSYDVDDIFLPNHLSEGAKGMQRAYAENKLAYKPKYSFFKSSSDITKMENVFEPSIFVDAAHVRKHGYQNNSVLYHNGWLMPLIEQNKILVDPNGKSTFVYDWSGELKVYKISGQPDTQTNFYMSQHQQQDYGTGVTKPFTKEQIAKYYQEVTYINS